MPNIGTELTKKFADLDPNVKQILGRPNFACAEIAEILRIGGDDIPRKAEAEQAAVIQFMLSVWEHHGDDWQSEGNKILKTVSERDENGKIRVDTALDCIGVLVENVPPSFQRCWERLEELARLGAAVEAMPEGASRQAVNKTKHEDIGMSLKWKKKPVEIEAIRTGEAISLAKNDWKALPQWLRDAYERGEIVICPESVSIKTLEGTMVAPVASWIIQGVKGELYPCAHDIFLATYERVE
jgi:hypothetical protein